MERVGPGLQAAKQRIFVQRADAEGERMIVTDARGGGRRAAHAAHGDG
jgi:hypothetical protein